MAKILLIESGKQQFAELVTLLEDLGHELLVVGHVKSALKALEGGPDIELIICALRPINGSSADLARMVLGNQSPRHVPLILASCRWQTEDICLLARAGARKFISLPVKKEYLETQIAEALAGGPPTILIVDDEKPVQELLTNILSIERFKVLTAGNAVEALEILSANPVAAVITDVHMPGQSGLDLLIACKAKYERMPVILITGYSDKYSEDWAVSHGADGYLRKPFKNRELVETVQKALSRYTDRRLPAKPTADRIAPRYQTGAVN
jgi:DNA-binding NtrC family response regulator